MHNYKKIPDDKELKNRFDFYIKQIKQKDNCWFWGNSKNTHLYGILMYKGIKYLAHRVSYHFYKNDKLIDGLVIDHLCNNKKCVNPNHLKQTTIYENAFRPKRWSKLSNNRSIPALLFKGICKNGHVISSMQDISPCPSKFSACSYQCRKCKKVYMRKRYKRINMLE